MLTRVLVVIFILSGTLNFSGQAFAQRDSLTFHKDKLKKVSGKSRFGYEQPFQFRNISRVDFYYDKKKIKTIFELEEEKNYEELKPALEEYVSNFGNMNFDADSEILWKLAQLYEYLGKDEDAKWLYRIILKHTESDLDYIRQYYNELIKNNLDYFVPIKYYYELVEARKSIDTLRPPQGVFLNMGRAVNSEYEDYGPSMNVNSDILIFTSQRNRTKQGNRDIINEDLYLSKNFGGGVWDRAIPLDGVNSPYNEGSPCISPNNKMVYFVRCKAPEGFGDCDIYSAELITDSTWGNVKNLGKNVNSRFWDSHPALSPTGDTLFFVSDRVGGFGGSDLYFTRKDEKGNWIPAENLGPVINTKEDDLSPFFHPRHQVLYFSSIGHLMSFGNFDIYKSHLENGNWQEPLNIGPLINGRGDEYYFTIDSDARYLYYAKSEEEDINNLDLYSFPLPMGAQPTATTVFTGRLTDSETGEPFKGMVSIIDIENGIEVAPKFIRPDGTFEFNLINNNKYLLVIQGEDFFRIQKKLNLSSDTALDLQTHSLNYLRLQFESIEFEENSFQILPEMKADLDKLVNYIVDNPHMKLNISGHTDSRGNSASNLELSYRRANAIKEYIVEKGGINEDRVEANGYGSTRPIIKNERTEQDRRVNRRVEFEIEKSEEGIDYGGWEGN